MNSWAIIGRSYGTHWGVAATNENLKRLQAETAAELDALLPAILDRAFRGEL